MNTYKIIFPKRKYRYTIKAKDIQAARERAIGYAHKHQLSFGKVKIQEVL